MTMAEMHETLRVILDEPQGWNMYDVLISIAEHVKARAERNQESGLGIEDVQALDDLATMLICLARIADTSDL